MKITYIVNPAAGGWRPPRLAALESLARDAGLPGEVWLTTAPGQGTTLAREAARAGSDVIVAVGGDGTANEVAAGLLGSDAALAVLPAGSGNDLARELGIPQRWDQALPAFRQARRCRVDVGRLNGQAFVQSSGAGLDGYVNRLRHRERRFSGALAYFKCAIVGLLTYTPREVTFELDGRRWSQQALAVTVANGQVYGGGMRIAPGARLDDGLFDVAIVGDLGRLEALRVFPTVYWGGHARHPKFRLLRGRYLRIDCDQPLPLHADGNECGTTPAEFTLEPAALSVLSLR